MVASAIVESVAHELMVPLAPRYREGLKPGLTRGVARANVILATDEANRTLAGDSLVLSSSAVPPGYYP